MSKVSGTVLERLRLAKGWSKEELARRTRIAKQTLSRLERGECGTTRGQTIQRLTSALGVEAAVLTGDAPIPEVHRESSSPDPRSQLNIRVGAGPRNALKLVADRYGVERSQIVELAPLLFVWAAEESLRQRKEKLDEIGRTYDAAKEIERKMPHVPMTDFTAIGDKLSLEEELIGQRNLFGGVDDGFFYAKFDPDTQNPFAKFLRRLTVSLGEVAMFEEWSGSWTPQYRVCPEEAAKLVGGDRDRAEEIVTGMVDLNEMPQDIRKGDDMAAARAEWVRDKADEYRQRFDVMKLEF